MILAIFTSYFYNKKRGAIISEINYRNYNMKACTLILIKYSKSVVKLPIIRFVIKNILYGKYLKGKITAR